MARVEKKDDDKKPFSMGGDVKIDNRGRDCLFETKHNGVTVEWSANISDALAAARSKLGAQVYEINLSTGKKTLRA